MRLMMRSRVWFVMLWCVSLSTNLFAQGPTPADPSTGPAWWYGSVAGVTAATALIVSVLKRAVGDRDPFAQVPTWVYAFVVGAVLTALCAFGLGTLPGNPWQLVMQAALNGASSSGFYEWLNNGRKSLGMSAGTRDTLGRRKP
jgi:hypothetical protein